LYTPSPNPSEEPFPAEGMIEASLSDTNECELYGPFVFTSSSSDKCQIDYPFTLQPNADPELGSELVLDGVAGFYACGPTLEVSNLYGEET
jgi:hypothetical protein